MYIIGGFDYTCDSSDDTCNICKYIFFDRKKANLVVENLGKIYKHFYGVYEFDKTVELICSGKPIESIIDYLKDRYEDDDYDEDGCYDDFYFYHKEMQPIKNLLETE